MYLLENIQIKEPFSLKKHEKDELFFNALKKLHQLFVVEIKKANLPSFLVYLFLNHYDLLHPQNQLLYTSNY